MGFAPTGKRRLCTAHAKSGHWTSSLNHLVGTGKQRRRHVEAELLGGFEIDATRAGSFDHLVGSRQQ